MNKDGYVREILYFYIGTDTHI